MFVSVVCLCECLMCVPSSEGDVAHSTRQERDSCAWVDGWCLWVRILSVHTWFILKHVCKMCECTQNNSSDHTWKGGLFLFPLPLRLLPCGQNCGVEHHQQGSNMGWKSSGPIVARLDVKEKKKSGTTAQSGEVNEWVSPCGDEGVSSENKTGKGKLLINMQWGVDQGKWKRSQLVPQQVHPQWGLEWTNYANWSIWTWHGCC